MNALVKKEIRQLLPNFLLGMLLAFSVWLIPAKSITDAHLGLNVLPFICCPLVLVMMMLDSFGHEMSAGTFSLLLSQPVPRTRVWWTKTLLLAAAALFIWLVWCISYYLHDPYKLEPVEFRDMFVGLGLFILAVYSGGLWTVLLFRQVAAAFWFTVLVPAGLLLAVSKLFENYPDEVQFWALFAGFTLYGIAGFLLARRLFLRAQDVAWTGGIISFSTWRYFDADSKSSSTARRRRPIAALFRKEFQLQSISLFCACVLLVLHIGVFFLRIYYANSHRNSLAAVVSEFFWTLWLVMPLVIGCTAVAEERKLGMADGQFCLPVSRRFQFAIKLIPTLIFGTLLGGVMPLLLETVAAHFGARSEFFNPESHYLTGQFGFDFVGFQISIVALAAGISVAAFFASTLAKNFLQALGLAIATILSCVLFVVFVVNFGNQPAFLGMTLWQPILPILIAIPVVPATLLWLANLNFKNFHENWRLWRRNLLGVLGAYGFILVISAALYNRAWEVFEPVEPSRGTPKLSLANPPNLHSSDARGNLLVQLPDGRVWFNSLGYSYYRANPISRWNELCWMFVRPLPKSAGPQRFIAGSNWVSVTARHIEFWDPVEVGPSKATYVVGYLDTVGIQPDGSLWISSEAKPVIWTGARMIRFGDETNWQQVGRVSSVNFLLLKRDGTLWRCGTNNYNYNRSQWQTNWPTVRAAQPRQIGTNSDWQEIISTWTGYARKNDGTVWSVGVNSETGKDELERRTNLDQIVSQSFSMSGDGSLAYVGKDGTLWVDDEYWDKNKRQTQRQVGMETNWLAVAMAQRCMVALKSDGSLWRWNWHFPQNSIADVANIPPTRMGIHNDWVGLTGTWNGVVSLAADGSLWLWPDTSDMNGALFKAPKQLEFLGNILGKSD
jgi:ABC-type transport system involved in multi-copper enzyme maturation permease subunit